MKKLVFLFLAGFLSISSLWAAPSPSVSTDLSTDASIQWLQSDDEAAPESCTIRIQGTYDGKQIDVTITVQADNCARAAGELLKSFAKK